MTALNRSTAPHTAPTTAGMLSSLANALPDPSSALGRAARAMAHRLATGAPTRADRLEAAELLAQLLDATDDLGGDDSDLLDEEFDV